MLPEGSELKKLFKEIVEIINSKAVYGDLLLIDHSELSVSKDFTTIDISNTGEKGIKIRAFDGEKWNETFTTTLTSENLKKVATDLANKIIKKPTKLTFDATKIEETFLDTPEIDPKTISLTKKIEVVNNVIDYFKKQEHLKNGRATYDEEYTHKIFCSENKYLIQTLYKTNVICVGLVEDENGATRYAYDNSYAPGFECTSEASQAAKRAAEQAKNVIKAKKLKPGKYHCILSGRITGLLAHESFGHGMESDTVYKDRALAKEWKGKKIASDFVNIIDDPSQELKRGSFYFDDEGEIAKPTYLIKDGVVGDYITELLTAKKMDVRRSGNGRTESFDHKAYARMSCTFFGKGPHNSKEMIKKVKDGIYLSDRGGGMEDPKGWGVQIQSVFGQRIKDGELVDEYYDDVGITGYLPTILKNIKEISNDNFIMVNLGSCGKGHKEWVPVSEGGPFLRIENLDLA